MVLKLIKLNLKYKNIKIKMQATQVLPTNYIDMNSFLEWANDNISVVWTYRTRCYCKPLTYFKPLKYESVDEYLERIINWVYENGPGIYIDQHRCSDEDFIFKLGEELFNSNGLLEFYQNTHNINSKKRKREYENKLSDSEDEYSEYIDESDISEEEYYTSSEECSEGEVDEYSDNVENYSEDD